MKITIQTLLFCAFAGVAAYNTPSSRRRMIQQAVASTTAATGVAFLPINFVNAIDACPPKSSNCIRTTWTPPSGTSKAEMAKTIKAVLLEYPQQGQQDVDKGGWELVQDDLAGSGKGRVEFKNTGKFAKFLNGGKPFIDDLVIEIGSDAVQVRSSSRVGDSDLGVNKKRLKFLSNALNAFGWDAPEPNY
jgi:hypothetical protein